MRRPRTFWTNLPLTPCEGVICDEGPRHTTVSFIRALEPTALWTAPDWHWTGSDESHVRLPTFTRAIPRSRPAFRAPGLDRIDSEARHRYESDGFLTRLTRTPGSTA